MPVKLSQTPSPRPHLQSRLGARAIKALIYTALTCGTCSPLLANTITVTAVNTTVEQEILYLNATADIQLPEKVQAALDKGVNLFFATNVKIVKQRKWLPDKPSANLEIIRRIGFHALTKKYVVDDLTFGTTSSFADLPRALSTLGKYRQVPLISQAMISKPPGARAIMRVRLIHNKLPLPLRLKRFFSKAWKLSSNWYAWPLK